MNKLKFLVYWNSDDFKIKYENAKKLRACETGRCLNAVGSNIDDMLDRW